MTRVLIIDDDLQFRKTLRLALSSLGFGVEAADSGKQGLELAAAADPDLIVLDWRMPGMDGIETCRALRTHSTAPIIMVSAGRSNSKAAALQAGAAAFLFKPFSLQDLLASIEVVLK